jgi:amino acid transporter
MSALLVLLVGTTAGKELLQQSLAWTGIGEFDWSAGEEGFDVLVVGATPTLWVFFTLVAAAVPVLRYREPDLDRPFRSGSPVVPLIFCATSLYMLWSSVTYAGSLSLIGGTLLIAGVLLLFTGRHRASAP